MAVFILLSPSVKGPQTDRASCWGGSQTAFRVRLLWGWNPEIDTYCVNSGEAEQHQTHPCCGWMRAQWTLAAKKEQKIEEGGRDGPMRNTKEKNVKKVRVKKMKSVRLKLIDSCWSKGWKAESREIRTECEVSQCVWGGLSYNTTWQKEELYPTSKEIQSVVTGPSTLPTLQAVRQLHIL